LPLQVEVLVICVEGQQLVEVETLVTLVEVQALLSVHSLPPPA